MRRGLINFAVTFGTGLILSSAGATYRTWQYWAVMCGVLVLVCNNLFD